MNREDNYALYLLEEALRKELIYEETANQMTQGQGFRMNRPSLEAFRQSKIIAQKRIPELTEAINKLKA
jgi:hypothetical protein